MHLLFCLKLMTSIGSLILKTFSLTADLLLLHVTPAANQNNVHTKMEINTSRLLSLMLPLTLFSIILSFANTIALCSEKRINKLLKLYLLKKLLLLFTMY